MIIVQLGDKCVFASGHDKCFDNISSGHPK